MARADANASRTRIIALGNAALMDGFAMIGIETVPDATPASLEALLAGLSQHDKKAVIFLERHLARNSGPWLQRVRAKGARIIVVEIPSLNAPEDYHLRVDELVRDLLGAQALNPRS